MTSEEGKKFMDEIRALCAGEVERIEAVLNRELTPIEKVAFQCGFTVGHSRGQEFARRLFVGALDGEK